MQKKIIAIAKKITCLAEATKLENSSYHSRSPGLVKDYLNSKDAILLLVIEGEGHGLQSPVTNLINYIKTELDIETPIHVYISNKDALEKFLKLSKQLELSETTQRQITLYIPEDQTTSSKTFESYNVNNIQDWKQDHNKLNNVVALSPASDDIKIVEKYKKLMGVETIAFYQPWGWLDKEFFPKVENSLHFMHVKAVNRGILHGMKEDELYFSLSSHRFNPQATPPVKLSPSKKVPTQTMLSDPLIDHLIEKSKDKSIKLVTSYGLDNLPRPFDILALESIAQALNVQSDQPIIIFLTNTIPESLLSQFNVLPHNKKIDVDQLDNKVYIINYGFTPHIKAICEHSSFMFGEGASTANEAVSNGVPMLFLGQRKLTLKRHELCPKQSELALLEKEVRTVINEVYDKSLVPEKIMKALQPNNQKDNVLKQFSELFQSPFPETKSWETEFFGPLFSTFLVWARQVKQDFEASLEGQPDVQNSDFYDDSQIKLINSFTQEHLEMSTLFSSEDELKLKGKILSDIDSTLTLLYHPAIKEFCEWIPDITPLHRFFSDEKIPVYAKCIEKLQNRESRNAHLVVLNTLMQFESNYMKALVLKKELEKLRDSLPACVQPALATEKDMNLAEMQDYIEQINAIDLIKIVEKQLKQDFLPQEFKETSIKKYLTYYKDEFSRVRTKESIQTRWDKFWQVAKEQQQTLKRLCLRYNRWCKETFPKYDSFYDDWVVAEKQIKFNCTGKVLDESSKDKYIKIKQNASKKFDVYMSPNLLCDKKVKTLSSEQELIEYFDSEFGSVNWL
tara:strand:+ start:1416 stop:3794 length:2379 start_codon:yes stop_codon:yes gene_type:complete